MDIQQTISQLQQFRSELYAALPYAPDATFELIDALASNLSAQSPVALSLNPLFHRHYSCVSKVIANLFHSSHPLKAEAERQVLTQTLLRLAARYLPAPQQRQFWLFGLDVTPIPRPYARTLAGRCIVYSPNPVAGNMPVTIGHDCSTLAFLPERESPDTPPWAVPLSMRRVRLTRKATEVGIKQIKALLEDETLPWHDQLCMLVADTSYSSLTFLGPLACLPNLVLVTRVAANRVFYRQPVVNPDDKVPVGHPTWYGAPFKLQDPTTWGEPDVVAEKQWTNRRGRTYRVVLEGWTNLLRTGTRDYPMYLRPFTLIRCRVVDEQGHQVYKRSLWLTVIGKRRNELTLVAAWDAYVQRFDVEHFFRFGKQRLLFTAYQTPDVEHEVNWWQFVSLAYMNLFLARELATALPYPWERYLPQPTSQIASPTMVQRDFTRIIRQIGTPAELPKRRGNSSGRAKGTRWRHRMRHPVIKRGQQGPKRTSATA
ncbi:MAG: transposase [Anaerolineae bacterium]|nr:transposase [Anaerolineae bacterium]